MNPRRTERFDVSPLLALVARPDAPRTVSYAARVLGISRSNLYTVLRTGMRPAKADECAIRAGFHPSEVWPDWFTTCDTDQAAPAA